jgi:transposase
MIVCGIDISKASFDVFLVGKSQAFSNDEQGFRQLLAFASNAELFVMEASGNYHLSLAEWLYAQGRQVSVVNPAQSSHYAKAIGLRNKTDKVDARMLAGFAQRVEVPRFEPMSLSDKELRGLMRHRETLVTQVCACRQQLADSGLGEFEKALLQEQIRFLRAQLNQCKSKARELLQDPELKRRFDLVCSIYGIGETTAFSVLGECRPEAFAGAKQIAAFAGVCPREFASGTSVRSKPRLSKMGNARLRKCLYMPCLVAIRGKSAFTDFYNRLVKAGKTPMAAIGALMHKYIRVIYGVLKSGKPFDPQMLLTNA